MIVRVRVGDETFEVAVGDLQARPIVATVEGQAFEVWPEGSNHASAQPAPPVPSRDATPVQALHLAARPNADAGNAVVAPIPGVIVAVAVAPGTPVSPGQELCALEAMKMRNIIRAPRAGRVSRVAVQVGQTVRHRDLLFELAE